MAFPTAVNSQITDSVSQANTKVLGDAPAVLEDSCPTTLFKVNVPPTVPLPT